MTRADLAARTRHRAWLQKQGLLPQQIAARLKGKTVRQIPDYKVEQRTAPCSGSVAWYPHHRESKGRLSQYHVAPAWNKGPIMVIAPSDIQDAGKKI